MSQSDHLCPLLMALFGQVVEPLQDHGSHCGSCTSLIVCCRLCLSPVHYKVKRPIATMNHVTVERALQNHSHLYFTAYVVSIKYFCHWNEKPITIFPSFLGHPCDKVWTETRLRKLSRQARMTLGNTMKVQTDIWLHSLLPRQPTHDPWD